MIEARSLLALAQKDTDTSNEARYSSPNSPCKLTAMLSQDQMDPLSLDNNRTLILGMAISEASPSHRQTTRGILLYTLKHSVHLFLVASGTSRLTEILTDTLGRALDSFMPEEN